MIQTFSKYNIPDFSDVNKKIDSYDDTYMVTLNAIEVQENLDDADESKNKTIILDKGSLVKLEVKYFWYDDKKTKEKEKIYNELIIHASNGESIQTYKLFDYNSKLVKDIELAYEANCKFLEILEENFAATEEITNIGEKIENYPALAEKKVNKLDFFSKFTFFGLVVAVIICIIFAISNGYHSSQYHKILNENISSEKLIETDQVVGPNSYTYDLKYSNLTPGAEYNVSADLARSNSTYSRIGVTSGKVFTPSDSKGTVTLVFHTDKDTYDKYKELYVINSSFKLVSYPNGLDLVGVKNKASSTLTACIILSILSFVGICAICYYAEENDCDIFEFDHQKIYKKFSELKLQLWNDTDQFITDFINNSEANKQYENLVPPLLITKSSSNTALGPSQLLALIDASRKELELVSSANKNNKNNKKSNKKQNYNGNVATGQYMTSDGVMHYDKSSTAIEPEVITQDDIIDSEVINGKVVELN